MLNFNLNYAQKYSKYFRAYYDHQEEMSEQKHVKIRTKKKENNKMRCEVGVLEQLFGCLCIVIEIILLVQQRCVDRDVSNKTTYWCARQIRKKNEPKLHFIYSRW